MNHNECTHSDTKPGPRTPLRHGSSATEICTRCGMWRPTIWTDMKWQSPPVEIDIGQDSYV